MAIPLPPNEANDDEEECTLLVDIPWCWLLLLLLLLLFRNDNKLALDAEIIPPPLAFILVMRLVPLPRLVSDMLVFAAPPPVAPPAAATPTPPSPTPVLVAVVEGVVLVIVIAIAVVAVAAYEGTITARSLPLSTLSLPLYHPNLPYPGITLPYADSYHISSLGTTRTLSSTCYPPYPFPSCTESLLS